MFSLREFMATFILVFSLIGAIDTLIFVIELSQSSEPTTEGAISFVSEILVFLVRDSIVSLIISIPASFLLEIVKELT